MSVFADAVEALFDDPHLATAAVYTPSTGSVAPVEVRIILRAPDETADLFRTHAVVPALEADVPVADLAQPAEGATLTVGGIAYVVTSFRTDTERLTWLISVRL